MRGGWGKPLLKSAELRGSKPRSTEMMCPSKSLTHHAQPYAKQTYEDFLQQTTTDTLCGTARSVSPLLTQGGRRQCIVPNLNEDTPLLHVDHLRGTRELAEMAKKAAGRFFTGKAVGEKLALATADAFYEENRGASSIKVVDPFGGDGRLIEWLLEAWGKRQYPAVEWQIFIWDVNDTSFGHARLRLSLIHI